MRFVSALNCLNRGRLPGQAVIQITTRCNARCAQCGMRVTNSFPRHSLDMDTVRHILEAAARLGMQAVSFTGGEPVLDMDRLTAMIRHAKKLGIPYIRTGTNGFIFQGHQAPDFDDRMARLADDLLESGIRNFWISLDSCDPDLHEANRGLPGVVQGMAKALPILHRQGLYPSVNLGINRTCGGHIPALTAPFEEHAFRQGFVLAFTRFFQFVTDLGFTIANCCYPMSNMDETVYQATSEDHMISLSRPEKRAMLLALKEVIPQFRSRIRLFTPLSSLDALITQSEGNTTAVQPCRGGRDYLFVDATRGHAYPCGYRSEDDLGPMWELEKLPEDNSSCRRCDWECFRDPSELFGPLATVLISPLATIRQFRSRPELFRLWRDDLRYYLACDTFDGTQPMRPDRLARFQPVAEATAPQPPVGGCVRTS